jgi:ribosomal subunit interface protein
MIARNHGEVAMPLRITGKNVDIGQALREHIASEAAEEIGKFFDGSYTGHVVVEREGTGYNVDCSIQLSTGTMLQSHAMGHDVYPAVGQAIQRIGKRLRRYKHKLKSHHASDGQRDAPAFEELDAQYQVLSVPDEDDELPDDFAPLVVAETTRKIATATVGRAVMDLDLTGAPVLVFRNAGTGGINVVYRRTDGNIGWIDPSLNDLAGG